MRETTDAHTSTNVLSIGPLPALFPSPARARSINRGMQQQQKSSRTGVAIDHVEASEDLAVLLLQNVADVNVGARHEAVVVVSAARTAAVAASAPVLCTDGGGRE